MIRAGAVLLALLAACGEGEAAREEAAMKAATPERLQPDGTIRLSEADKRALGLETVAATIEELPDVALRLGQAHAPLGQEALIVSPVAGRIPSAPEVRLGATVKSGDVVVSIVPVLGRAERVSLDIQGADIQGQIHAASRELALREADAARARDLAASNITSQAKLQEAETAVQTTRARLDALRQAQSLQSSGAAGMVPLRAPVAGTVVVLNAEVGAVVSAGEVLAQVLQTGPRWVDVRVPPYDQSGVGYEVSSGGAWVAARLLARGAVVKSDGARHDRVEVAAEQAETLLPGATVSVRVALANAAGVVVPESAIVPGASSESVWVEASPGLFAPRTVHVACRFAGRVRLTEGTVRAGDLVVTRGAMSLRGESVRNELRHTE